MLIYTADLRFRNTPGVETILEVAAAWLSRKTGESLSAGILAENHDFRLREGSRLQTWAEASERPALYALRLAHSDRDVAGRQWITELGVEGSGDGDDIHATVLLQTSEISARVANLVSVTRPLLVENLLHECAPIGETPGLRVKSLTVESARAFDYLVADDRRAHPLIVISPTPSGEFLVDADRVRSLVAGLADVVQIPPDTDTYALADLLGKEYAAWLGAVNILFPPRTRGAEYFVPRMRLLPDHIAELVGSGRSAESELLSIVAHRMNLPNSRRHIRPEAVRELSLRREIARRRHEAEVAGSDAELLPLYEEADRENKRKIQQLEEWNRECESLIDLLEDEKRALAFQNESLKATLGSVRHSASSGEAGDASFQKAREAFFATIDGAPTLEQCLQVIEQLFPERVFVLASAWKSAREAAAFANRGRAFELLKSLVTSYWQALADGLGDIEARKVFGNAYSAKESESVERNKRARSLRTFEYDGRPIEMWKHLKVGNKPSVAETLRIHFEWDGVRKRIVIGHCGEHLDHR